MWPWTCRTRTVEGRPHSWPLLFCQSSGPVGMIENLPVCEVRCERCCRLFSVTHAAQEDQPLATGSTSWHPGERGRGEGGGEVRATFRPNVTEFVIYKFKFEPNLHFQIVPCFRVINVLRPLFQGCCWFHREKREKIRKKRTENEHEFGDPCLCARVCGRATHGLPS